MIKKIKKNRYTEVYALGQHIGMSADKARRVIDQIRGRSYEETMMILELMPYRACYPILKLVYSAAANASHNMGFNERDLVISKAEVNKSTTVKKLKPRARGRSFAIKRQTCSITIVLQNISLNEEEFKRYQYNILGLNKPEWLTKEKYTDMTCYDMYNNGGVWDKK
uniref:Large ribosomal subunit protein uL22c n=1 Tax=Thladiantha dubia TaxID=210344 RepID=A0A6H0EQ59_9ROSI|nr:ribosomal protein L22 [Thladiantha dubia]YP_010395968.1 ribosomal protein L22 [Thladiantha nudiflora]YP_010721077.1 ribosomal protein L22 [Thladiantha dentata]QIT04005.1 ribosomal protein L22 [Thladiantha dubia]UQJ74045.1 ribosomal protein L22 [Thladiantha nudiflora]UTQ75240.1 ribosomal protein L22 [Thladiantha dentata]WEL36160.1 ribosomal protein L22 [Thladiantha nudiflora]